VIILPEGFVVKAGQRTVAQGCRDVGTGVTVPKIGADFDYAGLTKCLTNVKHLAPTQLQDERAILLSASSDAPFQVVVSTMDAARQTPEGEKLYPDVSLGVNEVARPGVMMPGDASVPGDGGARP
jgi:hypothetical protein